MNPSLDTPQGGPRIGYVLKVYPRFSETFIVTEILARAPPRMRASTPRSPGSPPGSTGWAGRSGPSTCGTSSPTA